MNSIKLINFKAFKEEFALLPNGVLSLNQKNFLLYGDNGSGKSSLYEAIKIIFFQDKLIASIPLANTDEEQQEISNSFWNQYKNKVAAYDFQIEINDESYQTFNTDHYQTFMIAMDEFCQQSNIRFDELLKKFDLDIDDIESFCSANYELIEEEVNQKLQEFREENIQIVIDNEDDFRVKVSDISRGNLQSKDNLGKYFNEAKLNLIVLLLLFESIKKAQLENKKKILVLDDFITSLDVSNRTFLMKYILENFTEFQILIFTHNVYFYNLIMYLVKDIYKVLPKWIFGNLYEIDNKHKFYIKGNIETVSQIRNFYTSNNTDIEGTGNKIRQRFEVLLYEFSKLLMIGAVEDSKKIIERIEKSKNIYYKKVGTKTASDLIDELEEVLNLENPPNLQNRLTSKINPYRQNQFSNLQGIIKKLKLYQKVTMHPMSHGIFGQSSFTTNEIEESLNLLEKFEDYLKDLIGSDVDGA